MVESKPDHFLDDLRLNNPWPELKRYKIYFYIYFLWLILCRLSKYILVFGLAYFSAYNFDPRNIHLVFHINNCGCLCMD